MIKIERVSFSYDNKPILDNVSFTINPGDRIGLVGPNGAGKTTLLKLIAGLLKPTSGSITKHADSVGYLPQDLSPWQNVSAIDYLKEMTGIASVEKELEQISTKEKFDDNRLQDTIDKLELLNVDTFESRVKSTLEKVNLQKFDLNQKIGTLSGGQKTRLSLVAILVDKHETLLLDEPTNNIDLEGLALLENFLEQSKGSYVIVSHDRRFLNNVATKIVSLNQNSSGVEIYNLGFEEFIQARAEKLLSLRLAHERFSDEKNRIKRAYINKAGDSVAADHSKKRTDNEKMAWHAVKEKAVGAHASAAHALKTRMEKLEAPEQPVEELDLNFKLKTSERSGDNVIKLNEALIKFDNSNTTIGPFDIEIKKDDRLVITGPNGSGKSTLLRLISADLKPISGEVTIGTGVKIGMIDQDQSILGYKKTVLASVTELINKDSTSLIAQSEIRQILAMFNLDAEKIYQDVSELSPGERSRALLAALVARGTNVLLLDEPTNHLDIDASEELEKAIASYKGTYIIVSHDREFIEHIKPTQNIEIINGIIV